MNMAMVVISSVFSFGIVLLSGFCVATKIFEYLDKKREENAPKPPKTGVSLNDILAWTKVFVPTSIEMNRELVEYERLVNAWKVIAFKMHGNEEAVK